MSDPETTPPTYRLKSVTDFLKVPEERRSVCLREFGVWIEMGAATQALLEGIPIKWPTEFIWVDDDKHHAAIHIKAGDETVTLASGTIGEPCPIWNDALAYPADHPKYPKELVETADVPYPDADPRCLAFDPLEVP